MNHNVTRPRGGGSAWTLILTSVAAFMVSLDALVVVTALPSMQRDLHADLSTLEWTVNAYTLAFAAGIVTAAAIGDRFGRGEYSPSASRSSRSRLPRAPWRRRPVCSWPLGPCRASAEPSSPHSP